MKYEVMNELNFLVSGVIGVRNDIERLLIVKGLSETVVTKLIDKIEIIIALSGELGKLLQRDNDLQELRDLKMELRKYKKGAV